MGNMRGKIVFRNEMQALVDRKAVYIYTTW